MRQAVSRAAFGPIGYGVLLAAVGFAYRATFITQGLAATDEGWLQSMGLRIAHGEVPYRDFDFDLPPLSIYKEAALIRVFGDAYGVLASRWAFVAVATLGSVLAFLIVRRYVRDLVAFMVTLPTVFLSVFIYSFSNYNYDAEVLLLIAVLLIVWTRPGQPLPPILAGVMVGLAFLAKQTYLAFLPAAIVAGVLGVRISAARESPGMAGLRQWPLILIGTCVPAVGAAAYFASQGAFHQFVYQAFLLYNDAHQGSIRGLIAQGVPYYVARPAGVAILLVIPLLLPMRGVAWERVRTGMVVLGLALLIVLTIVEMHVIRASFLVAAFELLWALNLVALYWGLRGGFPPPDLTLFAIILQYLAQITYNGAVVFYLGEYLTVPVALLFLHAWIRDHRAAPDPAARSRRGPELLVAILGLWLIVGAITAVRGFVYQNADRGQLTSAFTSPKLAGITSLPATTHRIDGMVATIDRLSRPGEPVFAFPDLAILYFLTDRPNPTRIAWYNTGSITADEVSQAVRDLRRQPPRVVFLQTYRESDFERSDPLDYRAEPKWDPVYEYLIAHYRQVDTIGDLLVLVPNA